MRRLVVLIGLLLGLAAGAAAEEFTVVALPDTQNYSELYPDIFTAQTQWCADNYLAPPWNVKFVTHLGDIVQNAANDWEWDNAEVSMSVLDAANVPYGTCVGNHDILYPGDYTDYDGTQYLSKFHPSNYADKPWFRGSSPSGLSNYQVLEIGGREWLFLHVLVETPAAELAWAQEVLNAHRDKPVMLSTHRYMLDLLGVVSGRYPDWEYTFEPLYRPDGIKAEALFSNFVQPNRQIYMVICGHFAAQYRQVSQNNAGLPVHEILVDYQRGWDNGGDGYLRLMTFKPDQDVIECRSFSPYTGSWDPGGDHEFNLPVDFDQYTLPPNSGARRFQHGVNGYYGTEDTWVGQKDKDASHGGESIVRVDDDTENGPFWEDDYVGQGLFRFGSITQGPVYEGDPLPVLIPEGATVTSASITLNLADDTDSWNPDFYCHRMTRSWNEGSTWNSLGNGLSPGDDCDGSAFATFQGDNDPDADYHRTFPATAVVQDWVNGPGQNFGFCIFPERSKRGGVDLAKSDEDEKFYDDGIDIRSSEDGGSTLRPALDVEYTYTVLNAPPTITGMLCASDPPGACGPTVTMNEGRQVKLVVSAEDPNPMDPLVFRINGVDVGYATGGSTIEHWVLMEDEAVHTYTAEVDDDEVTVPAGSVTVTVLNVAPSIVELTEELTVGVDELFDFGVVADDPGVLDVLTYTWDLDGDGAYDDYVGESGTWSYAAAGTYTVGVQVSDDDGGVATDSFMVEVEGTQLVGDLNCDGVVDFGDINPFVAALGGQDAYEAAYPDCHWLNADVNGDSSVDFGDINPFVAVLSGSGK